MLLFIRYDDQPIGHLPYNSDEPLFEFVENRLIVELDDAEEEFELEVYLLIHGYEQIMEDDPRREFILQKGWSHEAQLKYFQQNPQKKKED